MAKSETKKSCFIIMPITTPEHFVERYKGDADHFAHVLDHLFIPALENAGFNPISPVSEGSNVIQAEIIKQLSSCELVLCDMSILNPNVFYEFGIRTALDKPVALVIDNKTKPIPFDTSILNFHTYDSSVELWSIEKEKQALTEHVQEAYKKSKDHNDLWKYFGVAQTGMFKPEEAEMGEKIDFIMNKLSALESEQKELVLYKKFEPVASDFSTYQQPFLVTHPHDWGVSTSKSKSQSDINFLNIHNELESIRKVQEQLKSKVEKSAQKNKPEEPDSSNN